MSPTWQPLLTGELADRAREIVAAIAEDIGPPSELEREPIPPDWALAGGSAGTALFFGYLSEATGDEDQQELACNHLESALAGAAAQPFSLALWEGLLGVSWTYDHLAGLIFETEDEGVSDSDLYLMNFLRANPPMEMYDLISGLAGYGAACLEGLPRPGARQALDLVLDHLVQTAQELDGGITWFTPPEQLPEWQSEMAPEGYYNLGVAHGMPALVTLLARCVHAGIRADELRPVLQGAASWMLAQRLDSGFPSWVPKGRPAQASTRLAWCYGDPGVACALLAAGQVTGDSSWCAAAEDIAIQAARRDPANAGIQDTGICHGAAGLAHLFNRLYQGTGNQELAQSARHWFAETLEMRTPGKGFGGFQAWSVPRGEYGSRDLRWVDDPGFLTGSCGIGLCLLAAISDQEPAWDRSLMISAPAEEG